MNTDLMFSSKSNEWTTPQDFFDRLDAKFHFTLDAAATPENAKCAKYFTKEDDGLKQSFAGERVWLNPPYGKETKHWIRKAATEPSEITVMLIAARTDTEAWHKYILGKAEVYFVKGRLCFSPNGDRTRRAAFPSAVVIFRNAK